MTGLQVGDRRVCGLGTRTGGPCTIEIELRQGPNPALPPGWWEFTGGAWHPHSCRSWCASCKRKIGGPDRHAPGCEAYERLQLARLRFREERQTGRRSRR